jgi:hypothetical protein
MRKQPVSVADVSSPGPSVCLGELSFVFQQRMESDMQQGTSLEGQRGAADSKSSVALQSEPPQDPRLLAIDHEERFAYIRRQLHLILWCLGFVAFTLVILVFYLITQHKGESQASASKRFNPPTVPLDK